MRISLTYLLLLFSCLAFSQDFSIQPVAAYADSTAEADDFTAHAMLRNLSDETLTIAWQRINNDIPEEWLSYICSNITCAPPDVSMGTFSITANDSTNLDVYFVPDGVPGNGAVDLRLFNLDDTTQVVFASYFGNAAPVTTFQPVRDQIKSYPNPADNVLNIESDQHASVELYTFQGQLIQSYGAISNINLSQLVEGVYFLKIYNADKKLLSVNSFQKIVSK